MSILDKNSSVRAILVIAAIIAPIVAVCVVYPVGGAIGLNVLGVGVYIVRKCCS